ncbi:uncharacterized protein [Penaeus vannamei]|uniref:uncharacterized protein n=1 Tax=Penaeus vannamei TaxID=6689 RepID=UPI00387F3A49
MGVSGESLNRRPIFTESVKRAPKRVGGTAVASQLYRTSSFSSGRSSAADQEDMYSDASLEDDVLDLNHKECQCG